MPLDGLHATPLPWAEISSREIQWGQPYISAIPGWEKRRPSGIPLHVSMRQADSCRESAKRPADGNKSPMPLCQNVKTSKQPLRKPRRRARDGTRTEIREPRAPKDMQDESRQPVSATFCRPPRNAVRPEPAPRVSPARGMAGKRTNRVCTRTDSIRSGKNPPKPCFSPLSAPAGSALRQKSFAFAEGGSFLCGKRFCFFRGKTTAEAEKCSIRTVSPPAF